MADGLVDAAVESFERSQLLEIARREVAERMQGAYLALEKVNEGAHKVGLRDYSAYRDSLKVLGVPVAVIDTFYDLAQKGELDMKEARKYMFGSEK